jgi:hypothetical protein
VPTPGTGADETSAYQGSPPCLPLSGADGDVRGPRPAPRHPCALNRYQLCFGGVGAGKPLVLRTEHGTQELGRLSPREPIMVVLVVVVTQALIAAGLWTALAVGDT